LTGAVKGRKKVHHGATEGTEKKGSRFSGWKDFHDERMNRIATQRAQKKTTPVPSLKKGGELNGCGCTARRNARHVCPSAQPGDTVPLLFSRRGQGWSFSSLFLCAYCALCQSNVFFAPWRVFIHRANEKTGLSAG
jgi:hypothetical protein